MLKNKKVIAIIPARGGSKRIPNKNIKLLAGKPLIYYTIRSAINSKYIDEVFVSTDSEEIAEVSKNSGAKIIQRPEELGADDTTTVDVIKHAFDVLGKDNAISKSDILIVLQPTSPLRVTKDIDNALELFDKSTYEENGEHCCKNVISVCESNPYWNFVIKSDKAEPLFGWENFRKRSQDLEKAYAVNGAIYILTGENLLRHSSLYCQDIELFIMSKHKSVDIDDEFDFELAELLIKERNQEDRQIQK